MQRFTEQTFVIAKIKCEVSLDAIVAEFGIRDAIVLVDYPNWVNAAVYLKSKYGFRVVTDYMDDYTGFLNPRRKTSA